MMNELMMLHELYYCAEANTQRKEGEDAAAAGGSMHAYIMLVGPSCSAAPTVS